MNKKTELKLIEKLREHLYRLEDYFGPIKVRRIQMPLFNVNNTKPFGENMKTEEQNISVRFIRS